jgi:2-octaprenyl-6-methoxyphenol hydroxylase
LNAGPAGRGTVNRGPASNRSEVLRAVRDLGLGVVDRLPVLKRMFIREAAGLAGEVPKLLKGKAL